MRTIWKYPLAVVGHQEITVRRGAEILSIQMQGNTPTLWAIVDRELPAEILDVRMLGTGRDLPPWPLPPYVGTVQDASGYVWHFFCGPRV